MQWNYNAGRRALHTRAKEATVGQTARFLAFAIACIATATLAAQQPAAPAKSAGTVLITGSNRGLGLEFARQYAARGWKVIATARDPDGAAELRELAATGRVTIERLDVLDREGIAALAARYEGKPIDLLINNAG